MQTLLDFKFYINLSVKLKLYPDMHGLTDVTGNDRLLQNRSVTSLWQRKTTDSVSERRKMKNTAMQEAVEREILACYESMYRMAFTYVKNPEDAMDVVQDSACRAIQHSGSLKNKAYIRTWLFRIVINCSIDRLNRQKKVVPIEDPGQYMEKGKADIYPDLDLLGALDILNERERMIVMLRFFEERRLDEIAGVLELNISTVKSLLYRSLKKLRKELQKGEIRYDEG